MAAEPMTELETVDPNSEEFRLAKYIESLYLAAKKAKDPVAEKVKEFERFWRGDHWGRNVPKHRTKAVSNFTFAIIETEVTWLTENRPTLIVTPGGAEDTQAAKIVERIIIDHLWPFLNIRQKLKRMCRSALIRGKGFLKVTWDYLTFPELGGEVAVDYVPWSEVFLDPQGDSLESSRYIIHARVMPLTEIVKRWPENGTRVKPDPMYSELEEPGEYLADVDRPVFSIGGNDPYNENKHRALVIECWMKDDSYEMRQEFDPETNEPTGREYPYFLYPNGRLVIVANGVVLTDVPNPYIDGGFPFVDLAGYEVDDSPWDMGEVEQLAPIQRVLNMLESRFVDNARLMTNTVWVKSKDAGISADKITNEEGAVYTINSPNARFERVPPQPLPQHYLELYLQLQRNMETVSGIHDVTQGRRPTGITAATAISLLQEAGQARIRDKARNLEDAIRHMGRLIISRICQFYTPERVVRVRGDDGSTQFVRFDPSQVHYDLDLHVEAGSSLQMNEQQRFQMAIELFRVNGIDIIALLEATRFPGRDEIIARFRSGSALLPPGAAPAPSGPAQGVIPPLPMPVGRT